MSYYPSNFYSTYQYQQPQPSILQGKIVDGIDSVKAIDVNLGGYGVFPRGDFKEVYIKSWNADGTTQITVFKPTPPDKSLDNETLAKKISELETKMDNIILSKIEVKSSEY